MRSWRAGLVGLLTMAAALAALVVVTPVAPAAASGSEPDAHRLHRYAAATWRSMAAMVDTGSGLPTDQLFVDGTTSVQTSTTNIGAYLWSAVTAERLGLIGHRELVRRTRTTIGTLERMERHRPSGQFYNWYDHRDGAKLTVWPPDGKPLDPILSSVDNAWLATGLRIVRHAVPEVAARAAAIYDSMDFGFYYVRAKDGILFHYSPADPGNRPCCYDTAVSESRIADYLGISDGTLPASVFYTRHRTFEPDSCDIGDGGGQEQQPRGQFRTYGHVRTYEGSYGYGSSRLTPSWGGSMFEALMPSLFVPEERWGAGSWRRNHPLTVDAQIDHGLRVADYGLWGFSPSNTPGADYGAYGVDLAGMDPAGMPSNADDTLVDHGNPACHRPAVPDPPSSAYSHGIVTPHASFLALRYRPRHAMANLRRLEAMPTVFGRWGFRDSVDVGTGRASAGYLSLDQGMIMAALGNALADDLMRTSFLTPRMRLRLRPLLAVEEFGVRPRGCTITGTEGPDVLVGTPGRDVICALGGDDVVRARGGDDVVYGDGGADRVRGGRGRDVVYGDGGPDDLAGGPGADVLAGGRAADRISGGPGRDHLEGQGGLDRCRADVQDTRSSC